MKQLLHTKTQHTYDQLLRHPTSRNIVWRDIQKMLEEIGQAELEHNGNLKVTMGDHTVVFQAPQQDDMATIEQVARLRRLLKGARVNHPEPTGPHLLLVIDHHEAKIFHMELNGTVPERVVPLDPMGHRGHIHSSHDYLDHSERSKNDEYFEAIAHVLQEAEEVLIFGSGVSSGGAKDQFIDWLDRHHHDLYDRIMGAYTIDQSHLTEAEMLAQARDIYNA
ncbi:MAG: hypothetical protein ACOYON_10470 [Fimbriimonas sp.]